MVGDVPTNTATNSTPETFMFYHVHIVYPQKQKLTWTLKIMGLFDRNLVFQISIFRCTYHFRFRGWFTPTVFGKTLREGNFLPCIVFEGEWRWWVFSAVFFWTKEWIEQTTSDRRSTGNKNQQKITTGISKEQREVGCSFEIKSGDVLGF